ncbi:MAG: hypothetical protein SFZ03_00640 [Candidatus Melainabacteria bacterium]|nr:hypothetical protein [Candidatus Melainabacteria bacterium]
MFSVSSGHHPILKPKTPPPRFGFVVVTTGSQVQANVRPGTLEQMALEKALQHPYQPNEAAYTESNPFCYFSVQRDPYASSNGGIRYFLLDPGSNSAAVRQHIQELVNTAWRSYRLPTVWPEQLSRQFGLSIVV